jgi:type I restriction enzyme, S subunit
MSLPTYGEYKDSGIAWVGGVPAHWHIRPLLGVAEERSIPNIGLQENNLLSLSYGRIVRKDIDSNDGLLPESFETYQIVYEDDIVLRLTDLQNDKRSLRSAQVQERGIITSAYLALQPTGIQSAFFSYLLRAYDLKKVFYSMGGGLRQSMKFADLKRMPVTVPPTTEQVAIAAFLDRETAKIDTLIAEQEKLIDLLAEKRQATISHSVTKGLNPNAPMKDSGVAWLGEVPAHWNVLRIKHVISSIEQGWSPQCENFPVNSPHEWGVLKVGCVNGGRFQPAENKKLPSELEPIQAYSLKRGDLLISRANTRDLVGSAAAVEADFDNLMLCDKLYRLKLVEGLCVPTHLAAYLGTPQARSQIELEATGASSSMLNIGQSAILDLVVPLPSVSEQRTIQQFLDNETGLLDALNAKAQEAILLLKERRGGLIAAAVTGQIDVRGTISQAAAESQEAIAA